ncbi:MAG TPA: ABC transporter ATP-binding protein [Aggregatilineales bacterium]|nr:ABC transporter ATP-binding protein [Aggregatilineales bacterium]
MTAAVKSDRNNYSLVASHIRHRYTVGGDVLALDDVSVALSRETFTCLIGPSGCGKSTLLRVLSGLLRPDEGTVSINGTLLSTPWRRIGMVFQDANLMPWRTVIQNLLLPLEIEGIPREEQYRRAEILLEMTGLSDFRDAYPATLSGGMAQRLAIGRALIHKPEVLLLDEPFGALDAITREELSAELLRIWAKDRKTVLMVTHSIPEAILLSDRVLVMSPRPGQIVENIEITLPRPRDLKMVTQPEFVALEARLRTALRLG